MGGISEWQEQRLSECSETKQSHASVVKMNLGEAHWIRGTHWIILGVPKWYDIQ